MQNKFFYYYTIHLDNKNTLFYTYFKKYLFKISKNKLDRIIPKVIYQQKYEKKYTPIAEVLKLSFKKEKAYIRKKKKNLNKNESVLQGKLFNYFNICKWHILIGGNIGIQRDTKKLLQNNYRVFSKRGFSKNILKNNDFKLIIGIIYDRDIISFLEKNKELAINTFCCLIGIDEMYILKLSKSFCGNCFWLRRIANQKNLLEILLLTHYLRKEKIGYLLNTAQLFFIINYIINYAEDRNVLIKDMINQKISFHNKIIPFPFCSICKNYKKDIQNSAVIDNKIGIINKIKTEKVKIGKMQFYISTAKISNIIPLFRLGIFSLNKLPIKKISQLVVKRAAYTGFSSLRPLICGSVSTNKKFSRTKAINESIERYCATLYPKKYLVFDSYKNLKLKAIDPRKWILFSRDQYQNRLSLYKPFTESSKTYWVYGSVLKTRKRIYLPAPFIFIRYFFDKKEERIGVYSTTGLACDNKEDNVFLSGICENIERDACMLTWLLGIPPKKIINIDDKQIKNILKSFKASNINLHLFEISLDIRIPVVLALGINNNKKGPRILVGSACKPKLKDAILRAVDELTQGFAWGYLMNKYKNYNFGKNFENITHFEHHALFYSQIRDLSILNFISGTKRTLNYRNFKTMVITYKDVANIVYNAGYNIFYINLTSSDVSPLGLKVYKILIPGLQPLNSNHSTPFLNQKRIKRINDFLDSNKIDYSEDINLYPHPFA